MTLAAESDLRPRSLLQRVVEAITPWWDSKAEQERHEHTTAIVREAEEAGSRMDRMRAGYKAMGERMPKRR